MKKILCSFFGIGTLLLCAGCLGQSAHPDIPEESPGHASGKKIQVTTSFYPLAYFAAQVGGDLVEVVNLTPPGAEPHEYEPTPQDIAEVYTSNLFLYSGGGISPWAEKLDAEVTRKGGVAIDVSALMKETAASADYFLKPGKGQNSDSNSGTAESAPSSSQASFDPHFWLDPLKAADAVRAIKTALTRIDPEHAGAYDFNAQKMFNELNVLHLEYQSGLTGCNQNTVIVTHNAFGYLAERYHFTAESILGLSPETEPAPGTLARVADVIREKNLKYIFFETLVSPKIAETLATETGAETLVLNPIEGLTEKETAAGQDYLALMRSNLKNLQKALECPDSTAQE